MMTMKKNHLTIYELQEDFWNGGASELAINEAWHDQGIIYIIFKIIGTCVIYV